MNKKSAHQLIKVLVVAGAAALAIAASADTPPTPITSGLALTAAQRLALLASLPQQDLAIRPWAKKAQRRTSVNPNSASLAGGDSTAALKQRLLRNHGTTQSFGNASPISATQQLKLQTLNDQLQAQGGVRAHFDDRNGTPSIT